MGKPTTEKDQYYHAFEVKIAKIWNWNMRYLLKIHGYTRGIYIYTIYHKEQRQVSFPYLR